MYTEDTTFSEFQMILKYTDVCPFKVSEMGSHLESLSRWGRSVRKMMAKCVEAKPFLLGEFWHHVEHLIHF